MGTGIASIMLFRFPFQNYVVQQIGVALFFLNIVLYSIFTFMTLARYIIWPQVFMLM